MEFIIITDEAIHCILHIFTVFTYITYDYPNLFERLLNMQLCIVYSSYYPTTLFYVFVYISRFIITIVI